MLIDTHAHIVCEELRPRLQEIMQNAKDAGVGKILIICTDNEQGEYAIELAKQHSMFDVAIGFHPNDLYEVHDEDWQYFNKLIKDEHVVAIGEIGLDYHWDDVDKDTQKAGFIKQMQIANDVNKPILIHMREATQDTIKLMQEYAKTGGIMHCFNGSLETANILMKLGMYISFGGPLTFKNARGLPEVAKDIPIDRIFVETDCPYLTPHPFRGKQNEPKYVVHTFEKLCEIKAIAPEQLSAQMEENYKILFKK